jgi:hypothetical protein
MTEAVGGLFYGEAIQNTSHAKSIIVITKNRGCDFVNVEESNSLPRTGEDF